MKNDVWSGVLLALYQARSWQPESTAISQKRQMSSCSVLAALDVRTIASCAPYFYALHIIIIITCFRQFVCHNWKTVILLHGWWTVGRCPRVSRVRILEITLFGAKDNGQDVGRTSKYNMFTDTQRTYSRVHQLRGSERSIICSETHHIILLYS